MATKEDELRTVINKQLVEINELRAMLKQSEKAYELRIENQQRVMDAVKKSRETEKIRSDIIITWLEGRAFDNDC